MIVRAQALEQALKMLPLAHPGAPAIFSVVVPATGDANSTSQRFSFKLNRFGSKWEYSLDIA